MSVKRMNEFWALEERISEVYEFLIQIQDYIKKSEGCLECRILQDTEVAEKFLVLEEWESTSKHKASLEGFPKGLMTVAMDLFEKPPVGNFYNLEF